MRGEDDLLVQDYLAQAPVLVRACRAACDAAVSEERLVLDVVEKGWMPAVGSPTVVIIGSSVCAREDIAACRRLVNALTQHIGRDCVTLWAFGPAADLGLGTRPPMEALSDVRAWSPRIPDGVRLGPESFRSEHVITIGTLASSPGCRFAAALRVNAEFMIARHSGLPLSLLIAEADRLASPDLAFLLVRSHDRESWLASPEALAIDVTIARKAGIDAYRVAHLRETARLRRLPEICAEGDPLTLPAGTITPAFRSAIVVAGWRVLLLRRMSIAVVGAVVRRLRRVPAAVRRRLAARARARAV